MKVSLLRYKISQIIPLHIIKNASLLGVANISLKLTGMIIGIMIARGLGKYEFGAFALGIAYSGLSLTLGQLGLNMLIRREVARDYRLTSGYVGKSLPLMLTSISLTFLIVLGLVQTIGYSTNTIWIISIMFISQAFESLSSICLAVFVAHERMEYITIIEGLGGGVKVVSVALLLLKGTNLITILIGLLIISCIKFIFELTVVFRRFSNFRVEIDLHFWRQILPRSLPIAATAAPSFVLLRADTILLSILIGESTVGLYNAAYSLFTGLDIIPRSIFGAIFPRLSVTYVQSISQASYLYRVSVLVIGVLGLLIGLTVFTFAEPIILLLYGPEFSQSVMALRILGLSIPIFFVSSVCKGSLIAIDQQLVNMYIAIGGALFNIVLNIVIIPKLGFIGSSIATSVTYIVTSITMLIYTLSFFKILLQRTEQTHLTKTLPR